MARKKEYDLYENNILQGTYTTDDLRRMFNCSKNSITTWANQEQFRKKYTLIEKISEKVDHSDAWKKNFTKEWNAMQAIFCR